MTGKKTLPKNVENLSMSLLDISGIIQGEFGFITADGVYHVTVYATDENGSFKILSMKNLKVSERKYPTKIDLFDTQEKNTVRNFVTA